MTRVCCHPAPEPSIRDTTVVRRPRALFLGKIYAGWRTRFVNLERNVVADDRLDAEFQEVTGWREGRLERMPWLSDGVKGRLRATLEARHVARFPRPDVIWTSTSEVMLPYLWTQQGLLRRPLVLELDWTIREQEAMAPEYFGRESRRGLGMWFATSRERLLFSVATRFVAMSNWAAQSLVAAGIPRERVEVIHPGLDLQWWVPREHRFSRRAEHVRLLFVGGDFERKGGPELLRWFSARGLGRCELDIVTQRSLPQMPGVRVHRLEPNTSELRTLYQQADLFVLPTKADCFGHAAVEAMACGTPVLMTDVGGAADIVDHGKTGWLLKSPGGFSELMELALAPTTCLSVLGNKARRRAEHLFDGLANDRRLVDLMISLAAMQNPRSHTRSHGRALAPSVRPFGDR